MNVASRTTDGLPNKCPVCGKKVWTTPSVPQGDATCPHCGALLWFSEPLPTDRDDVKRLAKLGAIIESDDQGEVVRIRFSGTRYDDKSVVALALIKGVACIDVRETSISPEGVKKLQRLLPNTTIEY